MSNKISTNNLPSLTNSYDLSKIYTQKKVFWEELYQMDKCSTLLKQKIIKKMKPMKNTCNWDVNLCMTPKWELSPFVMLNPLDNIIYTFLYIHVVV